MARLLLVALAAMALCSGVLGGAAISYTTIATGPGGTLKAAVVKSSNPFAPGQIQVRSTGVLAGTVTDALAFPYNL